MVYYCPPFGGPSPGCNDWGTRWDDAFGPIATVGKTGFTEEVFRDTPFLVKFTKQKRR